MEAICLLCGVRPGLAPDIAVGSALTTPVDDEMPPGSSRGRWVVRGIDNAGELASWYKHHLHVHPQAFGCGVEVPVLTLLYGVDDLHAARHARCPACYSVFLMLVALGLLSTPKAHDALLPTHILGT